MSNGWQKRTMIFNKMQLRIIYELADIHNLQIKEVLYELLNAGIESLSAEEAYALINYQNKHQNKQETHIKFNNIEGD